jgi:hypothetical protein
LSQYHGLVLVGNGMTAPSVWIALPETAISNSNSRT